MYEYKVQTMRVVDGDTVDFLVDCGFGILLRERFRLYGIDAPETRTRDLAEKKLGLTSKEWLETTLAMAKMNGDEISIRTNLDKKGKWGRYLATIHINNFNINEMMVGHGLAVEYMK